MGIINKAIINDAFKLESDE